jgi:AcrR family transcriptional regulator
MNKTNGKIAEQSKQRMAAALLTIMKQYDYHEITVTQITREAELSRKTFYRLFPNKDAILELCFENLFKLLFIEIESRGVQHYWDVVQIYFDFWEKHKDLLYLFQKSNLLIRVFEYSYKNSVKVFEFVRRNEADLPLDLPLPYTLAFTVGGMHSMLLK